MKKLLLILLCVPLIGFGQQTYVPDDNFEQELINLGYDNVLDDYVTTANINTVTYLQLDNLNISDLTGIEGFFALQSLSCKYNPITSLDLSNNTLLSNLNCRDTDIITLNISNTAFTGTIPGSVCNFGHCYMLEHLIVNNTNVEFIDAMEYGPPTDWHYYSNLKTLEAIGNPNLIHIRCAGNDVSSLIFDGNLSELECEDNNLTSLDLKNLDYFNLHLNTKQNPALVCIEVSDSLIATNALSGDIDGWSYFSEDCNYVSGIEELSNNRELLKVTDILGRESDKKQNTLLFYIYNDGTVEKKIIIE